MVRRAERKDIPSVAEIYSRIHQEEQQGNLTTGWLPGVYPVQSTAETALQRNDLFVLEEQSQIVAAAIINQLQVDCYAEGDWEYPASEHEVMVLHTLVVDPRCSRKGYGKQFVQFYEAFAAQNGCPYLRMDTNERNIRARSLYRSLGFRESGVVPCEFNGIPDVRLVLLEKKI